MVADHGAYTPNFKVGSMVLAAAHLGTCHERRRLSTRSTASPRRPIMSERQLVGRPPTLGSDRDDPDRQTSPLAHPVRPRPLRGARQRRAAGRRSRAARPAATASTPPQRPGPPVPMPFGPVAVPPHNGPFGVQEHDPIDRFRWPSGRSTRVDPAWGSDGDRRRDPLAPDHRPRARLLH